MELKVIQTWKPSKNPHLNSPTIITDLDGTLTIIPGGEPYIPYFDTPILIEKESEVLFFPTCENDNAISFTKRNKKRLLPQDPMHTSTKFHQHYVARTREQPLKIPEEVQEYLTSIQGRIAIACKENTVQELPCDLSEGALLVAADTIQRYIPEIELIDSGKIDTHAERLEVLPLKQAKNILTELVRIIPTQFREQYCWSLPRFRYSSLDAAITTEAQKEYALLNECLEAALNQEFRGEEYFAHWLHPLPFLEKGTWTHSLHFPLAYEEGDLSKYTVCRILDVFVNGARSRVKMLAATNLFIKEGGLVVTVGTADSAASIWGISAENPALAAQMSSPKYDNPLKYFELVGNFPCIDMSVYGRKSDTAKKIIAGK